MYPVFGRRELAYDTHLDRWLNWSDPAGKDAYRAMACNIIHDHRVQPERAQRFDNQYLTGRALENALAKYFSECVRTAAPPDFVKDDNRENIVAGAPSANLVDEDTRLVTFLDLTGLDPLYRWAHEHPAAEYRDVFDVYEAEPNDDGVAKWLTETIKTIGKDTLVPAVLAVKRAIRNDSRYRQFHPVWVGLEEEVGALLTAAQVDRWWEAVGVHKARSPRWVIPLMYTVFEAGTLVRPTILDIGFYAHHFPSPPDAPRRLGGCCMDLRTSPKTSRLVHEFVHQEIELLDRYWTAAGSLCLPTTRPSAGDLAIQRQQHYQLLLYEYPGATDWMPRFIG